MNSDECPRYDDEYPNSLKNIVIIHLKAHKKTFNEWVFITIRINQLAKVEFGLIYILNLILDLKIFL